MLTIALGQTLPHSRCKTELAARHRVSGTRAITRYLHGLTRAVTRDEQGLFKLLQTPVSTLNTLAVGDTVLSLNNYTFILEIVPVYCVYLLEPVAQQNRRDHHPSCKYTCLDIDHWNCLDLGYTAQQDFLQCFNGINSR